MVLVYIYIYIYRVYKVNIYIYSTVYIIFGPERDQDLDISSLVSLAPPQMAQTWQPVELGPLARSFVTPGRHSCRMNSGTWHPCGDAKQRPEEQQGSTHR